MFEEIVVGFGDFNSSKMRARAEWFGRVVPRMVQKKGAPFAPLRTFESGTNVERPSMRLMPDWVSARCSD